MSSSKPVIPDAITVEAGTAIKSTIQAMVQGDVNLFYPPVFVTYATGRRPKLDAEGCGPGMYHAKWLIERIAAAEIECFSGLHVGPGQNWRHFIEKLGGQFSEARFLLVVLTPALFASKLCLTEINTAYKNKVQVIPILFEDTTNVTAQWSMITKNSDFDEKEMVRLCKPWFMTKNSIPAPPATAYATVDAIDGLLRDTILHQLETELPTVAKSLSLYGQGPQEGAPPCHLACLYEPPTGPKHSWFDELDHHHHYTEELIEQQRREEPSFNPSMHMWSTDEADGYLSDSAELTTSCVLWRATAPPIIPPKTDISGEFDDESLTARMGLPVLNRMVNEQKRKLDVLAVVMNRGAKYTSQLELAKLIAGCIVWIELADCAKKIEHRVLNLVTDFFIEVFKQKSAVTGAALRAVFKKHVTTHLPDNVGLEAGLVIADGSAPITRLPFKVGKISIDDHITDNSQFKLDHLKRVSSMAVELDIEQTVDVSHFHSGEMLYKQMNKQLKNAMQPMVIGVMEDWHGASLQDDGSFTNAVIQHACFRMCTGQGAVAQVVVRHDIDVGALKTDDPESAGALQRLLADCVPKVSPDGVPFIPEWAKRFQDDGSGKKASVLIGSHPIVIWIQPRNKEDEIVELPIELVKSMLKARAGGAGRRRKKKGASAIQTANDFSDARFVFAVPVRNADEAKRTQTQTFVCHTIQTAPTNVQMDEACGDLLRVTNVPQAWLDKLTEGTLTMIVKDSVEKISTDELHQKKGRHGSNWVDRVFRDTATSFVVRVKITDIVFMHVLRSCMFSPGLIIRLRSRLIARWRWRRQLDIGNKTLSSVVQMATAAKDAEKNKVLVEKVMLDKQLFSRQYMAVLQQLDKLTAHQRKKAAECLVDGNRTVHIRGPAGSGKTFVALHVALKTLEEEPEPGKKQRVLFMAPNPAMCRFFGRWLLQRFNKLYMNDGAEILTADYDVDIGHFDKGSDTAKDKQPHILKRLTFDDGVVSFADHPGDGADLSYNLVIIDEAHHIFNIGAIPEESLTQLLTWCQHCAGTRQQGAGVPSVVLCSDLAQFGSLTGDSVRFPEANAEVELEEVVRNSSRIVAASQAFSKTQNLKLGSYTEIEGPPLRPYIVPDVTPDRSFKSYAEYVKKALVELNNDFGSMPLHRCSAILVPDSTFRESLKKELGAVFEFQCDTGLVRIKLVSAIDGADIGSTAALADGQPQEVVIDTIESFDGMERLVILAVGLDTPRTGEVMQSYSMIYRAMTRAHLFVAVVQQLVPGGWLEFLTAVRHTDPPTVDEDEEEAVRKASESTRELSGGGEGSGPDVKNDVLVDQEMEDAQKRHVKEQEEKLQTQLGAITRVAADAAVAGVDDSFVSEMIEHEAIETSLWASNMADNADAIRVRSDMFNPYEKAAVKCHAGEWGLYTPTHSNIYSGAHPSRSLNNLKGALPDVFEKTDESPDYSAVLGSTVSMGSNGADGVTMWTFKFLRRTGYCYVGISDANGFDTGQTPMVQNSKAQNYFYRFGGEICHNSRELIKTGKTFDARDSIAVRYDANAGKVDWIKNGVHVAAIDCPKKVMMYPMACLDQPGEKIQLKGMVTGIESFYKMCPRAYGRDQHCNTKLYCGRAVQLDRSDGYCGVSNGPQCIDCIAAQARGDGPTTNLVGDVMSWGRDASAKQTLYCGVDDCGPVKGQRCANCAPFTIGIMPQKKPTKAPLCFKGHACKLSRHGENGETASYRSGFYCNRCYGASSKGHNGGNWERWFCPECSYDLCLVCCPKPGDGNLPHKWGKFDPSSSVLEGNGTIFRKKTNSPDYSLCMGSTGANSGTTTWKIKVLHLTSGIPLVHFGICAPGDFDPRVRKFKTGEMEGKMFYYSGGGARGTGEIEQTGAGLPAKTAGTIMEMIYDAKAGLLRFVIDGAIGATMTVPKEKLFHPFVSCDDPGDCFEFVSTVSAPRNEFKKSRSSVQRGQVAKKIVISGAGTSRVNGEYARDTNAAAQGKGTVCYRKTNGPTASDGAALETIDLTGGKWFICLDYSAHKVFYKNVLISSGETFPIAPEGWVTGDNDGEHPIPTFAIS